jgi:hypothetical protein
MSQCNSQLKTPCKSSSGCCTCSLATTQDCGLLGVFNNNIKRNPVPCFLVTLLALHQVSHNTRARPSDHLVFTHNIHHTGASCCQLVFEVNTLACWSRLGSRSVTTVVHSRSRTLSPNPYSPSQIWFAVSSALLV